MYLNCFFSNEKLFLIYHYIIILHCIKMESNRYWMKWQQPLSDHPFAFTICINVFIICFICANKWLWWKLHFPIILFVCCRIFDESIYSDLEVVSGKLKILTHSCILKARTNNFFHKLETILHANIGRNTFDEIYSFIR